MIPAGDPVTCLACGGVYEAPIELAGGGFLRGHVQGDEVCRERARAIPKPRPSRPQAQPDPVPLTDEERERKAERIRAKIRREGLGL